MTVPPTTQRPDDEARLVPPNFVTEVIDADLGAGRVQRVVTRFPPEPNGYLHIGHVKAISLGFGVARDYGGRVNLRMDDTNPTTEDPEYVRSIQEDIRWLGFAWDELRYASDYFDELYELARRLIRQGKAYVDSRSEEEIRRTRGTVTEPGTPSPFRDRGVDENLDLFARMRAGEFADGAHVLRATIDMASPNMVLRDPVLYRIKHAHHYRTGDAWPIYPLYDFAHPLSDAIEGITHSLCSLEFENNRAVYDWLVEALFPPPRPRQYEFARLALDYTVLSKRRLITLVDEGHVSGWDDPRMPTVAGLRRRGMPPEAVRDFVLRVGVTKTTSRTDPALLEGTVRDALNPVAPRAMAVLDPLEVELHGLPEAPRTLPAPELPDDPSAGGVRDLTISARVLIERDDFQLDPEPGFKRLAPGRSVRLRHAYVVTCRDVVRDARGEVVRLVADVVPDSLGTTPAGVRVSAAVHWVDAATARPAEFRLVHRLFRVPDPSAAASESGGAFTEFLADDSLVVRSGAVEAGVTDAAPDTRFQFERLGYFWRDPVDGRGDRLVFTRIVALKDGWGKAKNAGRAAGTAPGSPERGPEAEGERDAARDEAGDDAGAAATTAEPDPVQRLDAPLRTEAERLFAAGAARAEAAVLAESRHGRDLFEGAVRAGADPGTAAAWIVHEVRRAAPAGAPPETFTGDHLADLLGLVADGTLTTPLAREVLEEALSTGAAPADVARRRDVRVLRDDDPALVGTVAEVLAAHPAERAAYRGGKQGLLGFFVGRVMRATGGSADPQAVQRLVRRALDEPG